MTRPATCYVCGSAELAEGANPNSPTCTVCLPARDHVVSMQRGRGRNWKPRAVCPCGWDETFLYFDQREAAVKAHWLAAIAGELAA